MGCLFGYRNGFDLDQEVGAGEADDLDEAACGLLPREVVITDLPEEVDLRDIRHEHRHLDDVLERNARSGQGGREVLEDLMRLRFQVPFADE